MTAIMSIEEPRPRGTAPGERADRRRVSEAEHYFRCKICGGFIDGRDLAWFEDQRPAAAPGARWNSVASTVAVSETASETSSSTRLLAFSMASSSSIQMSGSYPMKCPSPPTAYARYSAIAFRHSPRFRTWNTDVRPRLCTSEHKPKLTTTKFKPGQPGRNRPGTMCFIRTMRGEAPGSSWRVFLWPVNNAIDRPFKETAPA